MREDSGHGHGLGTIYWHMPVKLSQSLSETVMYEGYTHCADGTVFVVISATRTAQYYDSFSLRNNGRFFITLGCENKMI